MILFSPPTTPVREPRSWQGATECFRHVGNRLSGGILVACAPREGSRSTASPVRRTSGTGTREAIRVLVRNLITTCEVPGLTVFPLSGIPMSCQGRTRNQDTAAGLITIDVRRRCISHTGYSRNRRCKRPGYWSSDLIRGGQVCLRLSPASAVMFFSPASAIGRRSPQCKARRIDLGRR